MPKFLFRDRVGRVIATTEARDRLEADLYGLRHVPGYFGYAEPVVLSGPEESMRQSFELIGLSESAARRAALGHVGEYPQPAPAGNPTDQLREAGPATEIELREATPLALAFESMGLSKSAARLAARGRR